MEIDEGIFWMNRHDTIRYFIIWFGIVAIALLVCMPHIMSAFSEMKMTTVIKGYDSSVSDLSESEIAKMKDAAEAYNEKIYEQQKYTPFRYQGAGPEKKDKEYYSLLNPSKDYDMMCTMSIPKISLNLPVAHGTNGDNLYYELGHMYGTSLPWGGDNTHSVIAGHSGLKSADLFTNIHKLKKGDKFYIYILDEIHEYTVDQIRTVLPSDESQYLQVEDGKDLCTLYTCTPIGVNDHRLLVRGTRTGTQKINSGSGGSISDNHFEKEALIKFLLWLMLPIALFLAGVIRLIYLEKKAKKQNLEGEAECETGKK